MKTIIIKYCDECHHLSHSGAFTKGGAKPVCDNSKSCHTATKNKKVNKKDPDDKFHWRHRVLNKGEDGFLKIPYWCPL